MFRVFITFLGTLIFGLSIALAQPVGPKQAQVKLISERDVVQADETFFVAFDLKINPKWHVYWRNAGDSGLPPEILWAEGVRPEAGKFIWAAPHEQLVLENEIMNYGYSNRLVLPFPLHVSADAEIGDTIRLAGTLEYQICEEVCIIERHDFDTSFSVGQSPRINEANGSLIAEWIAKAPTLFEGEARLVGENKDKSWALSLAAQDLSDPKNHIRFFPYENEIKHAAAQTASYGPNGATLTLTPGYLPELGETIDGVIVVERADGIAAYEISAPIGRTVLPGTTGQVEEGGDGTGLNMLAIAGLALLGGLILNLMPCVLPVLSIKAVGMVQAAAHGEREHLRAHGVWYTIGVVLSFLAIAGVFLALRSAGQLVSLGFQLQFPVIVSALALVMFIIGLWLLGMFELGGSVQNIGGGLAAKQGKTGAFFTGVLAAIVGAPCVGPFLAAALGAVITQPAPTVLFVFFLIGLGLALPFLLLSFAPGLHRLLPKPGAWMENLKQFFAFPMFLTAAWLLSVLGQQAGIGAIMWTVIGATLIGFGVWALGRSTGNLKTVTNVFGVIMLVSGVALPLRAALDGTPASASSVVAYSDEYASQAWSTVNVETALNDGRGVFVDFTATWCATCQLNKISTLKKASIQKAFADNDIVFMVADYTTRDDEVTAEIQKYNRPGVPMYLFYAPGSRTAKVLPQILSADLIMSEIEAGGN